MSFVQVKRKSMVLLVIILLLQIIAYAMVLFDVPIGRQVIGFLYLTFVPGFLITKLLRLDKLDRLETVLFSLGFSIAFLMLAGLFINELLPLFGISNSLSLIPLMIMLNSLILIVGVLAYSKGENIKLFASETFVLSPLSLLLMVFPILSVVGAIWVNAYDNNLILLTMIIAIAFLLVVGIISKKILPSKLYPLAILMIAISLLYHSSLISKYWVSFGSDTPIEYFVFKTTENNAYWSSAVAYTRDPGYGRFNSMLSITIIPTIYSILLSMDATYVIKVLYQLIFAFVPLALYQLWQTNFGRKRAFAAAFLLMAQQTFYMEMLGLGRQMIAEFFFVLLLLVILNKRMKPFKMMMCFMIFSFALVTSHYGLAQIFLFFISLAWFSLFLMKRSSRNLTVTMIVIFFVAMFSWYLYTSSSAVFDSIVSFGNYVYQQLGQFSNPASRGTMVLRGLGMESSPSIWNAFGRAFAYLTEFFIVVGFIGLITRRKNVQLKREYFIFTIMAIALLVALIAVPGLANTLNMARFYHILLFFLAPLFVLGVETFVKLISKRRTELGASILLLVVLVPYFLFQTNFMYEVVGTQSWSLPLSKNRMDGVFLRWYMGYFDESEVVGALWMSKNVDVENSKTYADAASVYVILSGYGMIYTGNMEVLSNVSVLSANANVYFNRANLVEGIVVGSDYLWNTTSISSTLGFANKVYSNGGCEIYKNR